MIFRLLTFLLLAAGLLSQGARADRMYTWTDDQGVVHITQEPPPSRTKVDNVIHYKPQSAKHIQAVEQESQKQLWRDEPILKPPAEKQQPSRQAETVQPQQPDYTYQYGGGLYTGRVRRYERRKAIKQRLESGKPIKRPRQQRITVRKR